MKAVICKQFGPPENLVVADVPSPRPGPGEVVVSVKAASVNFPDVLIIQNKYQVKATPPFTPGSEFAGVVKEVGEGVTHAKPGDRVLGAGAFGGFAEECLVPASARLVPIPHEMDFPTAASFLLTYGTSHHALCNRADASAGETLLVLGAAGGVGLAAVEIGKILGLRVIAAASSREKLAVCRAHGADEAIDYSAEDLRERIKALTGGKGVDLIYDPVGGPYTEAALRSSAWRARLLVIGFAAGDIPKIPLNLPLLKGCSIVGVFWGSFVQRERDAQRRNAQELWELFEAGRLKPVVGETHALSDYAAAFESLATRRAQGKVVLLP